MIQDLNVDLFLRMPPFCVVFLICKFLFNYQPHLKEPHILVHPYPTSFQYPSQQAFEDFSEIERMNWQHEFNRLMSFLYSKALKREVRHVCFPLQHKRFQESRL